MAPEPAVRLLLDLGDLFTKGLVSTSRGRRDLRYPSAVATRLLKRGAAQPGDLLLGWEVQRSDLDDTAHARERSYPGGDEFLRRAAASASGPALYVGWLAGAFGADRRVLGQAADQAIVGALTRKALLLAVDGFAAVDVVYVLDASAKSQVIQDHARALQGPLSLAASRISDGKTRRVQVRARTRVVDAPACAAAALYPRGLERERLLVVDVGYFRSKLAILSAEGCELQADHMFGVSDCVRRLLRDGQPRGLVEDELAAVKALEAGRPALVVAGRAYSVRPLVRDALRVLADDLFAACRRTLIEHSAARGETCKAIALIGGGSRLVGHAVTARLLAAGLGLERFHMTRRPDSLLLEGALRLVGAGTPA